MPDEPLVVFRGNTSPAVQDVITAGGRPVLLTNKTVFFRMRYANSEVLKVDATASIVNATTGDVRYDWNVAGLDTSEAGSFMAWWTIRQGTLIQDTPEFEILIDDHSPGLAVRTGAVARRVHSYIPETIDGMLERGKFTTEDLQLHINDVKEKLFATASIAAAEATYYSAPVLEHLAKLATVRIIPAGVDFWNNALMSQAVTGTNEQNTFPDRRKGLWDIRKALIEEVSRVGLVLTDGGWALKKRPSASSPRLSTRQTNAITPDPMRFGDTYSDPTRGVMPPRWPSP